jgi:transcription elongation factor Elf1
LAQAIKCPECGGEHVRSCTRLDEYGRVWVASSCETCGHKLSLEEMSRHVVN